MEKELTTSGKMTWGYIWRFILYYIVISLILAVIEYFMLGKVNMLVLSIFSVVTMGILIFFPTKLATSDIFKTRRMDDKNLRKFKRNIIIFYIMVMLVVSFVNALNYAVTIIGLEDARAQAEEQVQNSENIEDEEKTTMIESQNNYVEQVKNVQKETFTIITAIDAILFVLGVIIQFKLSQKYMNEEE